MALGVQAMQSQGDAPPPVDVAAQIRDKFVTQLKTDNFVLYFQPIAPTAFTISTPPLREILVRYKEEEDDLLPPGSFLPILEEQGLLPILDRWVVGRLLMWGRELRANGRHMPRCCVNLSIDTIQRDEAFADYVLRGIAKAGVPAASLTFEVLATDAIAQRQALARFMAPLRAAGVTFALSWTMGDDAAFDLALALGFSYMKLDGSFAVTIARQPAQRERLAAIVERARIVGIQTVCMLVEDTATLEALRTMRVDYVQGFGVDKPKPLQE